MRDCQQPGAGRQAGGKAARYPGTGTGVGAAKQGSGENEPSPLGNQVPLAWVHSPVKEVYYGDCVLFIHSKIFIEQLLCAHQNARG